MLKRDRRIHKACAAAEAPTSARRATVTEIGLHDIDRGRHLRICLQGDVAVEAPSEMGTPNQHALREPMGLKVVARAAETRLSKPFINPRAFAVARGGA